MSFTDFVRRRMCVSQRCLFLVARMTGAPRSSTASIFFTASLPPASASPSEKSDEVILLSAIAAADSTGKLRPDLKVHRTGFLGLGRKLEVSGGGVKYTVDRRAANEETAAAINSRIPTVTFRKP